DWRTVGLYWSPNEIRFYIDGVEVKRLQNYLIHQPMHVDISNSINRMFTKEDPIESRLRKWGKVDYVRAWKVNTREGKEPASNLTLDTIMQRKFVEKYGRDLLSVFDRFPWSDTLTVQPYEVADLDNRNKANLPSGAFEASLNGDESGRNLTWIPVGVAQSDVLSAEFNRSMRKKDSGKEMFRQAGGTGNSLWPRTKPRKLSDLELQLAHAREDRSVEVGRNAEGELVQIGKVENAAMTEVEFDDPIGDLAGVGGNLIPDE
ncbi:MAG: hypothetical protein AAGJ35_13210, partial [Myxococcota bacterium]